MAKSRGEKLTENQDTAGEIRVVFPQVSMESINQFFRVVGKTIQDLESVSEQKWHALKASQAKFLEQASQIKKWERLTAKEVRENYHLILVLSKLVFDENCDSEFILNSKHQLAEFIVRLLIEGFEKQPKKKLKNPPKHYFHLR